MPRSTSRSPIAPLPRWLARAALAAALALAACGDDAPAPRERAGPPAAAAPAAPPGAAVATAAAAPRRRAAAARRPRGQLTVHVRRPTTLHARPGGRVVARLAPRTEFGSPRVLPVVRRAGRWLGVIASALPNGRVGWIRADPTMRAHRSRWALTASLARREVVVRRDGRVVRRFPVAVGSPSTPTPTGRFAVTDKLLTGDASSPYGCCILALSGRQPRTPQGWGGGDRLAIHATPLEETIGTAASLGCLRAAGRVMRRLVATVPLGTVVTIRR